MENLAKSYLCMVVHFAPLKPVFIGKTHKGRIPGRLGGANAPPTTNKQSRKRGFGRVFVALVWLGGHTQLVEIPDLMICPYLLLVVSLQLQDLTKQPLIVWLQPLDSGRILFNRFSTSLICQDLP